MIGRWIFLRDARLSRRTRLTLALLALFALALSFPLRLALAWGPGAALSARAVEGSVWNGWITDLRVASLPLGTVRAALRPLPLLILRRELAIERPGPTGAPDLAAIASGGSGWLELRDVNGQVALGDGLGDLPVGSLGFRDFRMAVAGGRCRSAAGEVSLLLGPLSDLMPTPIGLSGRARCVGNALHVPMTSPGGRERLFLRIDPQGRWRAELVLSGLPVEVAAPLLDRGFSSRKGGIGIVASGRL